MIYHDFFCVWGCLLKVTHQSQVVDHYVKHLEFVLKLIMFREDDSDDSYAKCFVQIMNKIGSSSADFILLNS